MKYTSIITSVFYICILFIVNTNAGNLESIKERNDYGDPADPQLFGRNNINALDEILNLSQEQKDKIREVVSDMRKEFRGKQKHPDVRVWVFTSPSTKRMADLAGYTEALETAGCEIFAGACGINIPPKEAKRLLGGKVQVTDHVKHAYYAPGLMGELDLRTVLKPTEGCVKAALNGKV